MKFTLRKILNINLSLKIQQWVEIQSLLKQQVRRANLMVFIFF